MQSKATTVDQYLAELPADRRVIIEAVRKVILKNLDKDIEEGMSYGMICYVIPHRIYPAGYHCDPRQALPYAALASQKQYMSLYLDTSHFTGFREEWEKSGKKLDMGKVCIRFRKLDDLPLELIGRVIKGVSAKKAVEAYEEGRAAHSPRKRASKVAARKKAPTRKKTTKKAAR
jgi:uncharacterized protein YdhG (YjbR/CyaY superfamily)